MIPYIAAGLFIYALGYVSAYLVIQYIDKRDGWDDHPNDDQGDGLGPTGRVILAGQRVSDDELPQIRDLLEQERAGRRSDQKAAAEKLTRYDDRLNEEKSARLADRRKVLGLGDHLARAMCLPHAVPEHLNPNRTTRQGEANGPFEGSEGPTKGTL